MLSTKSSQTEQTKEKKSSHGGYLGDPKWVRFRPSGPRLLRRPQHVDGDSSRQGAQEVINLPFFFFFFFVDDESFLYVFLLDRRYNVPYPTLYAIESENKDAKLFNCVQVSSPDE